MAVGENSVTLDEVLADEPAEVKEPEKKEPEAKATDKEPEKKEPEAKAEEGGPARDENGRFVAKQELKQEPQDQQQNNNNGMVPQQALHASRQKEQETRQENDLLRTQLAEMRGQIELLTRQRQPAEPEKKEPEKAPDIWENPEGFLDHHIKPLREENRQQADRMSRMLAITSHGREKVSVAFDAMKEAVKNDPVARFDYHRIMQSDHPYGELVDWHAKRERMKVVGDDPEAFFKKRMDEYLADPANQKVILDRFRSGATINNGGAKAEQGGQSQPGLPPSLSNISAADNRARGDEGGISDSELFTFATSR